MAYEPEVTEEEAAETLTLPPEFEFDGEPGDTITLKLVSRGEDGSLQVQRVTETAKEEPAEDEELTTTLRRDMAAIPEE